jgi:hypothetical protein
MDVFALRHRMLMFSLSRKALLELFYILGAVGDCATTNYASAISRSGKFNRKLCLFSRSLPGAVYTELGLSFTL